LGDRGEDSMNPEFWHNFSHLLVAIGIAATALGGYGQYYFGKQVEQRNELEAKGVADRKDAETRLALEQKATAERHLREQSEANEKALAQNAAEQARRRQLLVRLRNEYVLSHDGLTAEMLAGTAPLPKEWVDNRLMQLGESWKQETYY
jgi:hypothetical protein